jgi:hypothetical protein
MVLLAFAFFFAFSIGCGLASSMLQLFVIPPLPYCGLAAAERPIGLFCVLSRALEHLESMRW